MHTQQLLMTGITMFSVCLLAAQELSTDKELATLAEALSSQIKQSGKKKVSVLDFTDLQGRENELGRYLAERIALDLVRSRKDFSVMDRANLKKILEEHKLTLAGLVEPDNAKKLGQFSGVDAIVLGNITGLGGEVQIIAKVIATDTAERFGAALGKIPMSQDLARMLTNQIPSTVIGPAKGPQDGIAGPGGQAPTTPKKPSQPRARYSPTGEYILSFDDGTGKYEQIPQQAYILRTLVPAGGPCRIIPKPDGAPWYSFKVKDGNVLIRACFGDAADPANWGRWESANATVSTRSTLRRITAMQVWNTNTLAAPGATSPTPAEVWFLFRGNWED